MANTIDLNNLPKHIALIMDGNGRWAKAKGLPRTAGHKAGSESLRKLLTEVARLGIEYVTVYAFSTENWSRPDDEVNFLLGLMEEYIDDNIANVKKNDYRIRILGNTSMLERRLAVKIRELEEITKNKNGLCLNIALSYGGKDEVIRAVKKICKNVRDYSIEIDDINEKMFSAYLDTWPSPDPDLIIRTSGEKRLSNFLIWQGAYSEVYFSPKFWPDFNIDDLEEAIRDYQSRERRYGNSQK